MIRCERLTSDRPSLIAPLVHCDRCGKRICDGKAEITLYVAGRFRIVCHACAPLEAPEGHISPEEFFECLLGNFGLTIDDLRKAQQGRIFLESLSEEPRVRDTPRIDR